MVLSQLPYDGLIAWLLKSVVDGFFDLFRTMATTRRLLSKIRTVESDWSIEVQLNVSLARLFPCTAKEGSCSIDYGRVTRLIGKINIGEKFHAIQSTGHWRNFRVKISTYTVYRIYSNNSCTC